MLLLSLTLSLTFIITCHTQTTIDPGEGTSFGTSFRNFNTEQQVEIVSTESNYPETQNFFDLMFIDWGGHYTSLPYSPRGRRAIQSYNERLSRAYTRSLRECNGESHRLSRQITRIFWASQFGREFNFNRIQRGLFNGLDELPGYYSNSRISYVYRYNPRATGDPIERVDANFYRMHVGYNSRYTHGEDEPEVHDPVIQNEIEVQQLIDLRVPIAARGEPRPHKPFRARARLVNGSREYHGYQLQLNHFFELSVIRRMFTIYNDEWFWHNVHDIRTSDRFLMLMQVRYTGLAMMEIQIMENPHSNPPNILGNHDVYRQYGQRHNAWPAANLFTGPPDFCRVNGPVDSFEESAAKVIHGNRWAQEGRRLMTDIQEFLQAHEQYQTVDRFRNRDPLLERGFFVHVTSLCERYLRLLRSSRGSLYWKITGKAVPPLNPSDWQTEYKCINNQKARPRLQRQFCFVGPTSNTWKNIANFGSCAAQTRGVSSGFPDRNFLMMGGDSNVIDDDCFANAEFLPVEPSTYVGSLPAGSGLFDDSLNSRALAVLMTYIQHVSCMMAHNLKPGKSGRKKRDLSQIIDDYACESEISFDFSSIWKNCSHELGETMKTINISKILLN